jgi:hypothetical protein
MDVCGIKWIAHKPGNAGCTSLSGYQTGHERYAASTLWKPSLRSHNSEYIKYWGLPMPKLSTAIESFMGNSSGGLKTKEPPVLHIFAKRCVKLPGSFRIERRRAKQWR